MLPENNRVRLECLYWVYYKKIKTHCNDRSSGLVNQNGLDKVYLFSSIKKS
jgi:hypothetical protein